MSIREQARLLAASTGISVDCARARLRRNTVNRMRNCQERRKLVKAFKDVPCADCKQRYDPVCMDFDHLRDKVFSISQGFSRPIEELTAELAKCEVVCSNCHRLRTKNRRKS